jgi:ClpX C4-type zinc finger protein
MVGIVEAASFRGGSRRCSFCGRREESVEHLVRARGGAWICDRCVGQAHAAIASAGSGQRLLRILPAPGRVRDQVEAEQALERSFEMVFTAEAPVAERCAAIDGGANLVATMQEVHDRYGPARDLDVAVDYIRFLSEDEAEVHFVLLASQFGPSGLAQIGHAVRVGDDWKVSRETWCCLVSMVGVRCPPPDD